MISKLTFTFDVDERGGLFLPPSCQPPQSVLSSTFQWAAGLAWLIRTWWQIGLAIGLLAVYYMKLFLNQGITFPFFTKQICNRHSFHIQNRHFPNIQAEISSGFNATIFCMADAPSIICFSFSSHCLKSCINMHSMNLVTIIIHADEQLLLDLSDLRNH